MRQELYGWEGEPALIVQEAGWASGPVCTHLENLATTGVQTPACSALLYRLHYPSPFLRIISFELGHKVSSCVYIPSARSGRIVASMSVCRHI